MIRCIQCGLADLEPKSIQLQGTVRGESYTVTMLGFECPHCDYKTIDGSAMPEFQRLLADEYRARHGLLTSERIRGFRRSLGMSQEQFAEHIGAGLASVKRWEMGKIQEPHNNDRIVEAIRKHAPVSAYIALGEIRGSTATHGWQTSWSWSTAAMIDRSETDRSGAVQECFEDELCKAERWSRETRTSSRLQFPSPRTVTPFLASFFSQRGRV